VLIKIIQRSSMLMKWKSKETKLITIHAMLNIDPVIS